jgi:hypothetical protein
LQEGHHGEGLRADSIEEQSVDIALPDRECRHRDGHEGYDQGGEPSLTFLDAEELER